MAADPSLYTIKYNAKKMLSKIPKKFSRHSLNGETPVMGRCRLEIQTHEMDIGVRTDVSVSLWSDVNGLNYSKTHSPFISSCLQQGSCLTVLFMYSGVQHVVISYVFTFLVPCCDVRYDFRIKTMFGLIFTLVVFRMARVLVMLFGLFCAQWCPVT